MKKVQYAAFLLPVIEGKIYLGQRGTNPHQGAFGPIGGKLESFRPDGLWHKPQMITKPGGHQVISLTDLMAQGQGLEFPYGTAIREFSEEVFNGKTIREGDITDLFRLGFVVDYDTQLPDVEFECYFHMANVHRKDFSLSHRELTSIKPLEDLAETDRLYPLTEILLTHLAYMWEAGHHATFERFRHFSSFNFLDQIPRTIKISQPRETDMMGAAVYYGKHGLLDLMSVLHRLLENRTSMDPTHFQNHYENVLREIKSRVEAPPLK